MPRKTGTVVPKTPTTPYGAINVMVLTDAGKNITSNITRVHDTLEEQLDETNRIRRGQENFVYEEEVDPELE